MRLAACLFCLAAPSAALALELEFPTQATPIAETSTSKDSVFLPTAAFSEGAKQGVTAEGAVTQMTWRVGAGSLTTLQLLKPLRVQLEAAGYQIAFECEDRQCGGFDFRYQLELLPEPDMHVSLGDYRYLLAQRHGDDGPEYASLVVSRSANAGFVQLTQVGATPQAATVVASTKAPRATVADAGPVGAQLEATGHATLGDLSFKPGRSELADQDFASLQGLAAYLTARPERTVVLVGHTDSEGSLAANVALSKRRAAAVMDRLVRALGVSRAQVSADGVGFLAPVATNLTKDGRAQNRRVEAILTSTE
ncbi:Outer membrane protein [Candidatus Rhodobacter oscarellae]|uniref:Outer membrane protein n=1 Tax=Candidatus Rhodobacter oscarellae TaxID=1675527 RepID=A0A0J9E7M4_9RHOB|nr:OmpA family protein [Candidatus Rhodobacter lobularis]KMW58706.1 Outer membrane protein [Candidatus Rhodobacter lobularis]